MCDMEIFPDKGDTQAKPNVFNLHCVFKHKLWVTGKRRSLLLCVVVLELQPASFSMKHSLICTPHDTGASISDNPQLWFTLTARVVIDCISWIMKNSQSKSGEEGIISASQSAAMKNHSVRYAFAERRRRLWRCLTSNWQRLATRRFGVASGWERERERETFGEITN